MTTGEREDAPDELGAIDRAIEALELQRAVLGDDVVETTLQTLRQRRSAAAARQTGEQRKLVTVLFADLVDFTVLSRELDAEDTRTVVGRYFAAWQKAIDEAGGVVEKFIGDAVMAVFGLYRAQEDDARRAVRCALAMRTALAELADDVQATYGVRLRMRVGVDTGDVVVSALGERAGHEFVAVGPTVNRASRIQSAAPPDGVLISADTHRQVRGWFTFEPLPGLQLKGIDRPTDTYLVLSERPHGFRLDRAGGVEGVESRTVGRDVELHRLQERFADVVDDGRWKVMTIVGDAGVGKSRLLLEFDQWLGEQPDSLWWFRGRAFPSGQHSPGALLRDLMATRLGVQESDPVEVVRHKLAEGMAVAFGEGDQARQAARVLGAWLGFAPDDGTGPGPVPRDPQALRGQATDWLARYFARLSERAPVVVLLEDLHWADDGSLRWIDAADDVLTEARVFVVATARPVMLEERPHWGEGLAHHMRLTLQPLSRRESRALLAELLQRVDDVPPALVDVVVQTAEGNPFYIEELVTWLVDEGVVVPGPERWTVVTDRVEQLSVPSTLRGVLQARIDALTTTERRVLQRASVVGRVFWDDAVNHLRTRTDAAEPESDITLERLRRKEIVFERELSAFEATREFLFKHALLRDVAYDGVLRAQRAAYHGLAARWLADISERSHRAGEFAALIAEHHDRAGDADAAHWYLRAGRQALAVHALEEATRLLSRGIDVLEAATATTEDADRDAQALRFDLLLERQTAYDRRGERELQQQDLARLASALPQGDPARSVRLDLARSRWDFAASDYDEAERWAASATATAERAGMVEETGEAQLWRGKALTWHGLMDDARQVLARALDVSRVAGRGDLEGETLRYLSMVENNESQYEAALTLAQQALEVHERDNDTEGQSVVLAQFATVLFNMGRYDEARAYLEQTLPIFRMSGHRYREAVALGNMASICLGQCQLTDARRWGHESLAVVESLHDKESMAVSLDVLGQVALAVGDWDTAQSHLLQAVEVGRDLEGFPVLTDAYARLAYLALDTGRLDEALRYGQLGTQSAAESTGELQPAHAHLAYAYVLTAAGRDDESDAWFARAAEVFTSLELPALTDEATAGRARLALRAGRADAALEMVEELLPGLVQERLLVCARPAAMLLACCDVLDAAGDPRAPRVRSSAQAHLQAMADQITDELMRQGFLGTPLNRALMEPATIDLRTEGQPAQRG
jgi:class 3 adenylate cyclase/tetratricopeptide (TPR) repeat protein